MTFPKERRVARTTASRRKGSKGSSGRGAADQGAATGASWALAAVVTAFTALAAYVPKLPFTTPYSPRLAALVLSAAGWTWVWALDRDRVGVPRRLAWAALAVGGVTVLSAAVSAAPGPALTFGAEGGLMGAPAWLALLVVFGGAAGSRFGRDVRDGLSLALLWAVPVAAVAVVLSLAQRPVSAGFGNGNYVGAVLLLLAPVALVAGEAADERRWTTGYRAAAVLMWLGAVFARSAIVWAGTFVEVAAVVAIAPALLGDGGVRARRALLIAAAGVAAAAVVFSGVYAAGALPAPVQTFVSEDLLGVTARTRVEMWKAAAGIVGERPLLGVGPDGFQLASQRHLSARLMALEPGATDGYRALIRDPHSLPWLAAASLGLVGLAALVWLAVEWVLAIGRGIAEDAGTSRGVALAIGVGAFLLCMLTMPWAIVFAALPALVAGLAVASRREAERARGLPRPVRVMAAVAVTVGAVWLAAAGFIGDAALTRASRAETSAVAVAEWRRAVVAQPTRPYVRYELLYTLGYQTGEGLFGRDEWRAEVDAAPPEVRRNAAYLANLVQVGLDEAYLTGRTDLTWEEARTAEAALLSPNHPDVLLEQAHLALLRDEAEKARAFLDTVEGYPTQSGRYWLYRYYLARLDSDPATTAEALAALRANAPYLERLAEKVGGG